MTGPFDNIPMNNFRSFFMISFFLCFFAGLGAVSCREPAVVPDTPGPDPVVVEVAVKSASLSEYPNAAVTIDDEANTVSAVLPFGSKLGKATLILELSGDCTSEPASGTVVDLTRDFNIFLTASTGAARKYRFSTSVAASDVTKFKWLSLADYLVKGEKNGSEISFTLPYGADLSRLKVEAAADYELTFVPDITQGVDLTSPVEVKVYAEDGVTSATWTLSAKHYPKDTGVRGVYLPSPAHTGEFLSYDKLCKSMDLLQELNFNCLYVCAWAATRTAWPSEVLLENSTYKSLDDLNMYRSYSGGSGDAVADMISEGHKRGIKVILWFEYGFMHASGGVNVNDPLLAKHPEWIGLNDAGDYCNYNGNDFYYNSYDPEVQQFMLDLIVEAVRRYPELDGVQGDDRLPASPVNAGFNKKTVDAYMAETGNAYPVKNDSDWNNWKMDILNGFAVRLHDAVKAERQNCLVCFAPNKYPWAYNNLCQDWPSWVKSGACEFLTVQCYVTANYERDVDSQIKYMKEITSENLFQPAMILKNGGQIMDPQMISDELCYNRKVGTNGEAQFWFDGLLHSEVQKMFKLFYSYPVEFPEF